MEINSINIKLEYVEMVEYQFLPKSNNETNNKICWYRNKV